MRGPAPGADVAAVVDQSRDGVRVVVYRTPEGTVVDADCQCLGLPHRVHSTQYCPLLRRTISERADDVG